MMDHRFVVSGCADEIGADLGEELDVLESLGIGHLEDRGISVTSIGKIAITEEFEPHLERFGTAVEDAKAFDTEYIRLFSYFLPEAGTRRHIETRCYAGCARRSGSPKTRA